MKMTIVTGNEGKLREWQRLIPDVIELVAVDVDLDEIQSIDMSEIIADKVKRAYAHVGGPVLVEDVAAGLDHLSGLPGPFIKFFEKKMGRDALFQLANSEGESAIVECGMAYYDGTKLLTVKSEVRGTVVPPRGKNGFGFDKCFVPDGQNKTYGEMSPSEKDAISHRAKVIKLLCRQLNESKII